MRRLVTLAALAVLGAAFIVCSAFAADQSLAKSGNTDNTYFSKIGGVDANGKNREAQVAPGGQLSVLESAPAQNMVLIAPSFYTGMFVYGADGVSTGWVSPKYVTCDSTVLLAQTLGYNRLALALTVSMEDSVGAAMFAVQWRGAGNSGSSDTTNTYVLLQAKTDTIGTFIGAHYRSGAVATSAWGSALSDTSTLYPGEQRIVFTQQEYGANVWLPVKNTDGTWFTPPYFGARFRLQGTFYSLDLSPIGSSLNSAVNTRRTYGQAPQVGGVALCETCGGSPTASPSRIGRWVIIRADLYGWRE